MHVVGIGAGLLAASLLALGTRAGANEIVTHSYDALGRLVATSSRGTVNDGLVSRLGYDPAGNRSTYVVAVGAGGPAVADASFETWRTGGYDYGPAVAGVTFLGYSGVQANGSAWGFQGAPDGTQTAFVQAYNGGGGSIALAVTGLVAGASYRIGFSLARRTTYGGVATVDVVFDQVALGSFAPPSGAFTAFATPAFTAAGASGRLVFSVPPAQGDSSAAVDRVTIERLS